MLLLSPKVTKSAGGFRLPPDPFKRHRGYKPPLDPLYRIVGNGFIRSFLRFLSHPGIGNGKFADDLQNIHYSGANWCIIRL